MLNYFLATKIKVKSLKNISFLSFSYIPLGRIFWKLKKNALTGVDHIFFIRETILKPTVE